MKNHISENMNQFRQRVRALWDQPYNPKHAMIVKTTSRFEAVAALRTFATELGARAIILDIEGKITDEQQKMLDRRGPRIVVLSGLDTMESTSGLCEAINSGGRALPVYVWEVPGAESVDGEQHPEEVPA